LTAVLSQIAAPLFKRDPQNIALKILRPDWELAAVIARWH
jgi:hypothetical protein